MKYPRPNVFLYFAGFTVNLLFISTSGVFSWTSPAIPKLYSNDTSINPIGRPITATEESLLASLPNIGAIVGSITSKILAAQLGKKKTLIINCIPFFVSHIILSLTRNIYIFYICRLVLGQCAGVVLTVLPSYVGEISENSNRGTLISFLGFLGSFGHLVSFGIGPLVTISEFSYIQLIPIIIFLCVFIPFIPESPYYYLAKNDQYNAVKSLKKLRKNPDVTKEYLYLQEVINEEKTRKVDFKEIALPATRNGLIVGCVILIFQSLMGAPIILLYLQSILEASGDIIPSHLASIAVGIVQITSCLLSSSLIDRIGRKSLLHISSTGCSLSLLSLGIFFLLKDWNYNLDSIFWLPAVSLITFFLHFNFGYGPVPWTICGELFSSNVKPTCVSIVVISGFASSYAVVAGFPFVRNAFGMSGVFLFFSGLAASSSIFVYLFVPETKGKSFQEIQKTLSKEKSAKVYSC